MFGVRCERNRQGGGRQKARGWADGSAAEGSKQEVSTGWPDSSAPLLVYGKKIIGETTHPVLPCRLNLQRFACYKHDVGQLNYSDGRAQNADRHARNYTCGRIALSPVLDDFAGHLFQAWFSVPGVPAAGPSSVVREPQPKLALPHGQQLQQAQKRVVPLLLFQHLAVDYYHSPFGSIGVVRSA